MCSLSPPVYKTRSLRGQEVLLVAPSRSANSAMGVGRRHTVIRCRVNHLSNESRSRRAFADAHNRRKSRSVGSGLGNGLRCGTWNKSGQATGCMDMAGRLQRQKRGCERRTAITTGKNRAHVRTVSRRVHHPGNGGNGGSRVGCPAGVDPVDDDAIPG